MKYPHLFIAFISAFISNVTVANNALNHNSLQQLLRHALTQDPKILEAQANVSIAEMQANISQAGHYPIISVANTQILSQKHKDTSNQPTSRPSLRGHLNLFSWGAIENAVTRDKHKADYFRHKQNETKEQVGKTIVELYLTALRAKETIVVYQRSLERHQRILDNIQTIAEHDEGRAFEISEAESRLLQAESVIEQQTRVLNVTLSQLNRYAPKTLVETSLQDPFAKVNLEQFLTRYKNKELMQNPTYLAQQKELESAQADIKVNQAKRLPAVNLEGEVYNKGYNVSLGVSWNIFDAGAYYAVDQSRFTESAAQAKLQEILLELQEQARSAEIDMKQNSRRLAVAKKQIVSQQKVVKSTELQFDIAQRSLLDVLNAYKELSDIEVEEVNIQNDFRIAALNYLVSQAQVAKWAGIQTVNLKF